MRFLYAALLLLSTALSTAQRPVALEDIWQNGALNANSVPGFNFQNDGVHYTRISGGALEQYDLRTEEKTATLLDAASLKTDAVGWSGRFDDYTFSPDESKILLAAETEPIYRRSKKSQYFVYDRNTQKLTRLSEGPKQRDATFSPDGSKVAFVLENDLYCLDLASGKTQRITSDGKTNAVINGAADWVYEEEFELVRAFEWSPDGKRIAYLRFDESAVPEFTMEMYRGKAYPELATFKYPKVGEKNAEVTAQVYELANGKTTRIQTDVATAPDEYPDFYLPRLQWTPDNRLCLTRMNRLQNQLLLLLADLNTGRCNTLYEEKNKAYIDLNDAVFLSDGSGFILPSEKSGFNHLHRFDMQGREVKALTKGPWDVTGFYGIDEKNETLFYQAAAVNPMQRELYSVKLNGKDVRKISGAAGHHGAQFSKTFDYFVDNYSTINSPPQYAVYDRKGKKVRDLEQNRDLKDKQKEYGTVPLEFFNFKTSENIDLNGWLLKPTAPAYRDQKLPVLMFVYGGPGSQQALDQWRGANYWWFQMLAQQGYVVACVDNRGTGARGEAFKKVTYKQLGKYETMDQIEAAKYLGTKSFVDPDRIGIFGWSYGGYMSSLCLLKGHEVFKAAIAVAPVTNWKWYDSVYTERYMQTYADNPGGYEENSPNNFADKLKGNYLLVHGIGDDNVHFQHSAEMARNLIAADKPFDTMIYPNRNHGISGDNARLHLYKLMTKFLNEKLKTPQPGTTAKP
jgi:dipeptidyl-peptidase 4